MGIPSQFLHMTWLSGSRNGTPRERDAALQAGSLERLGVVLVSQVERSLKELW